MTKESELIRIHKPTKELLNDLKIIEAESFDSVINRIIQSKLEDYLELSMETKEMLSKRLRNIKEGKVFSGNELLERIRKKRRLKNISDEK